MPLRIVCPLTGDLQYQRETVLLKSVPKAFLSAAIESVLERLRSDLMGILIN